MRWLWFVLATLVNCTTQNGSAATTGTETGTGSDASASSGNGKPDGAVTIGGKTYTQNACPTGDKLIQGSWRLVDGTTEDPETPLTGATTAEKLTFKGTGFVDKLSGSDRGVSATQTTTGWYFCGDASEVSTKHYGVQIVQANPNGAFGNKSGDAWFGEFLMKNPNQLAILVLDDQDKNPAPGYLFYCRIGSTVNGHACTDPLP